MNIQKNPTVLPHHTLFQIINFLSDPELVYLEIRLLVLCICCTNQKALVICTLSLSSSQKNMESFDVYSFPLSLQLVSNFFLCSFWKSLVDQTFDLYLTFTSCLVPSLFYLRHPYIDWKTKFFSLWSFFNQQKNNTLWFSFDVYPISLLLDCFYCKSGRHVMDIIVLPTIYIQHMTNKKLPQVVRLLLVNLKWKKAH